MLRFLKLLRNRKKSDDFVKKSFSITNQKILEKYTSNPEFPYLISFPRTGSHWLRNVMELYFEKPSLTRVFFYKNPEDFTCFHIHDEDLSFNEKKRVIYLYRNPVETIFSQMKFYNEDVRDTKRIAYWATKYGKHLEKWLLKDELSTDKVVLSYEGLKSDFDLEFTKLTEFLNAPFKADKLKKALERASKEEIKKRVTDDPRVINSTSNYSKERELFSIKNSKSIRATIKKVNFRLIEFF